MTQSTVCKKVTSLLALYIDNKLDISLRQFVSNHLEVCPECYQKYLTLKELIRELRNAYKDLQHGIKSQEKQQRFNIKEYERFQANLSAYFDNELPLDESVNMKKYMIKFSNARLALENMYHLHTAISSATVCVKKTLSEDYSKNICKMIYGKSSIFTRELYLKAASFAAVVILFVTLIGSFVPLGKMVLNKGIHFIKKTIYVQNTSEPHLARD